MLKSANKLIHGKKEYQDYFVVNWCFFSVCNFSCSYCPEDLHDGKNRGLPIDVVKNFCLQVIKEKSDKKVFFEFTGGEVTYHKNFVELFTFLKDHGAETGLISNGSRDLEFWKKNKHLIDHICLSFHPEQGDADHFYEVVKLLSEEATVHVNIMMLPEKFDKLHDLARKISSEIADVSIAMQALFENISGKIFAYTPEQKDILDNPKLPWGQNILHMPKANKVRKVYRGEMIRTYTDGSNEIVNTPELIARGENNWFGWECYIGVENLVVDYHGNVRRGWCGIGGIIGNISENEIKIPSKPITCMAKVCHCGLDIMATKEVR